jgi:hypothetical protein
MSDTPSFGEVLPQFLRFVKREGYSTDLVWVFGEEVTNCRRRYWIRVPVPGDNLPLAREYYEYGRRKGLGVSLEVLCRLEGRSVCYVWVPEDQEAASYAMMGGDLHFKVFSDAPFAGAIHSRVAWWCLSRLNSWRGCVTFANYLPRRANVSQLIQDKQAKAM